MSPEGAAICDNCDEILDTSFLGMDEAEEVEGEKTDVGPAPTSPMPARLRKPPQNRRGGWNPTPQSSLPAEQRRPYLSEPAKHIPTPAEEARIAAEDLKSFFRSLSPADRWAAGATSLLLLLLALPWRWTREDEEVIGIIAAWPILILGAAVLVFVYLRARKAGAALDRRLRLAQLTAAACAAIFTGLYLPWASQTHALRAVGHNIAVTVSAPQIGAYLGLVCAVAALFASIPALKGD